jgi:hypothetical protein
MTGTKHGLIKIKFQISYANYNFQYSCDTSERLVRLGRLMMHDDTIAARVPLSCMHQPHPDIFSQMFTSLMRTRRVSNSQERYIL